MSIPLKRIASRFPALGSLPDDQAPPPLRAVRRRCDHWRSQHVVKREYRITAKPEKSENPTSNAILEQIHQVLGILVRTVNFIENYFDEDEPWSGIVFAAEFAIFSPKIG